MSGLYGCVIVCYMCVEVTHTGCARTYDCLVHARRIDFSKHFPLSFKVASHSAFSSLYDKISVLGAIAYSRESRDSIPHNVRFIYDTLPRFPCQDSHARYRPYLYCNVIHKHVVINLSSRLESKEHQRRITGGRTNGWMNGTTKWVVGCGSFYNTLTPC